MSAAPETNGGLLLHDLKMPDFKNYAVTVPAPGAVESEATRVMGTFLRDMIKLNERARATSRLFGPDETACPIV